MRGYLKSPGHTYKLEDDVVTIGRGSGKNKGKAHIPLNDAHAEKLHARIEKHDENSCFVLVDLNSAYGTYINDHRVQNNSVKLAPGDVIRFGRSGIPHELSVQFMDERSRTSSLTRRTPSPLIPQPPLSEVRKALMNPGSATRSSSSTETQISSFRPNTAPEGQRNGMRGIGERAKSVPFNMKMTDNDNDDNNNNHMMSHPPQTVNAFEKTLDKEREYLPADKSTEQPWYVDLLRDKEERILHMGDEISRLSMYESESYRKDGLLRELRERMRSIEQNFHELQSTKIVQQQEKIDRMSDEICRLAAFEAECERKEKVIGSLRESNAKLEIDNQVLHKEQLQAAVEQYVDNDTESIPEYANPSKKMSIASASDKSVSFEEKIKFLQHDLNEASVNADTLRETFNNIVPEKLTPEIEVEQMKDEIAEKSNLIKNLENQLSTTKKELSLSHGLAKSLQRNVQKKENEIRKLNLGNEKDKRFLKECKAQINLMSGKFSNMREEKKHMAMLSIVEQDLQMTKEELLNSQQKLTKLQEKIDKQSREIRKCHKQVRQFTEAEKRLASEVDAISTERDDIKRARQICQVGLEQTSALYERIRSSTIQAVFSTPGATKPETLVSDEEVYSALAKIIRDRNEFHQQMIEAGINVPPLVVSLDILEDESKKEESMLQKTTEKKGKGGRKSPKSK